MHISMSSGANSTPTRRATTTTPDQDVKENITPTPSLKTSQPSPEGRGQPFRKRNRMSSAQKDHLESLFQKETHPSRQKKRELVDELGVDYRTLTIWFQNKRQLIKRKGGSVPSPPARSRKGVSKSPDQHVYLQSPSVLHRVSSPSMDSVLQPVFLQQVSEVNSRATPSPGKQGTSINNPPLKKSMGVKPLLSLPGSFIAPKSPSSKAKHGKDQAQLPLASTIRAQELWRYLSSSPASPIPTSNRGSKAQDPDTPCGKRGKHTKDQAHSPLTRMASAQELWRHLPSSPATPSTTSDEARDPDTPCGKRRMTLEWACNRQAKRKRGSSDHSSDTDGLSTFWVGPSSQSITSALSLLSFARGNVSKFSPVNSAASPDVMHGASLLLSLKYSWRGRNAGNYWKSMK